jgi:histidyl-tRNA synthetase
VELLLATDRVLKELNVGKFKIRISHKSFLPEWFKELGVPADLISKVAIIFDKVGKNSLPELTKELNELKLPAAVEDKLSALLIHALNKNTGFSIEISKEMEALRNSIILIRDKILSINPNANIIFDPFLVRGFDYYTGPVFEINVENKDFTFSVGGGGRYDGLIEKLGGPKGTPAVGISLGFERILLVLTEKDEVATRVHYPRVYIANNGQTAKDIHVLAESLRSEGIQVEACLEKKDFVKQMKAAEENGIEYAITDFQPGGHSFKVRQLSLRQDREMPLAELYDVMKRLSGDVRT